MTRPSFNNQIGFSLLEIMVVVTIIGLMASLLIGSLVQDLDRVAKLEAERFMAVMQQAGDEAILSGQALQIEADRNSYTVSLYRFDGNQNEQIAGTSEDSDSGLLRRRVVADGIQMKLKVESLNREERDGKRSILYLDPIGMLPEFSAEFTGDDLTYTVFLNDKSEVTLEANSY